MGNEFLVSALRAHTSVLVKVVTRQQDNVPMLLEDLLTRLATLTYEHGHDPASRTSSDTERRQYDDEGTIFNSQQSLFSLVAHDHIPSSI